MHFLQVIILETGINCTVLMKLRNIFQLKTNYKQSSGPKPKVLTLQWMSDKNDSYL